MTAAILNYIDLNKYTDIKVSILKVTVRPLIASAIMGVVVYMAYQYGVDLLGVKKAAFIAIMAGIAVYVVALPITGTITKEDMALLPKGEKLYGLMKKLKLMK